MQQVQLQVSDEFKAAGDLIGALIADIMAHKPITTIAGDALPNLMAVLGSYSAFAADYKIVDNQIYLLKKILEAVETKPAA